MDFPKPIVSPKIPPRHPGGGGVFQIFLTRMSVLLGRACRQLRDRVVWYPEDDILEREKGCLKVVEILDGPSRKVPMDTACFWRIYF